MDDYCDEYNTVRQKLGDACRSVVGKDWNVSDVIVEGIVPPAIVIQAEAPKTGQTVTAMSSDSAEWHFLIKLFVGKVNEKAAQAKLGELVSPSSGLRDALEDIELPYGYVMPGVITASDITVSKVRYAYAKIAVTVRT